MRSLFAGAFGIFLLVSVVSAGFGEIYCYALDEVVSRSTLIALGDIVRATTTFMYRPQEDGFATSQFSYNVTVFEFSIAKLAKGFSISPIYVVGNDYNSSSTFTIGQRYVLFLSGVRSFCAEPSPPWSPCTLPSTRTSRTFYMTGPQVPVLNNTVRYGSPGGPCTSSPTSFTVDQFMTRISYLSYGAIFTIVTALSLLFGTGILYFHRKRSY